MATNNVRAAIASERYPSDDKVRLHDMHVHDQVLVMSILRKLQ